MEPAGLISEPSRKTRSGAAYSPFGSTFVVNVDAAFDLGPLLQTACAKDVDDATDCEETDGEEMENTPSDLGTRENDPNSILPRTNGLEAAPALASLVTLPPPSSSNTITGATAEPEPPRTQQKAHLRRKRKREERADGQGHEPRAKTKAKIITEACPVLTTLVTEELRVTYGAYEAFRKEVIRGLKVAVTPAKGLGLGIQYIRIDPKSTKRVYPILDHKRRVVGAVCSPPDAAFFTTCDTACNAISEAGYRTYFSSAERKHRRGRFPALNFGVLHGKGTKGPVNLKNEPHDGMILRLRERKDVIQLACFGSACFEFWSKKVYEHYRKRLDKLFEARPGLKRIFKRSIFPCAALNFGPRVCTYKHRDTLNCPFGMCAIQSLGNFDHTKGGHLILWQLNIMLEFPPGFLALIPSATITHSNSPVSEHETRLSFTQFCPGGLLRYVDNDFRTEREFAEKDPAGFAEMQRAKAQQWEERLKLLTVYDELLASL